MPLITYDGYNYQDIDWEPSDYSDRGYVFLTDCVHSDAESIQALTDTMREITYRTFISRVGWRTLSEVFPTYYWLPGKTPCLRMKDDWAVQYAKGKYRGVPCYVVVHSGIEYIFVTIEDYTKEELHANTSQHTLEV